jgi:hypothetical protein
MLQATWKAGLLFGLVLIVSLDLSAQARETNLGTQPKEDAAGKDIERLLAAHKLIEIGYRENHPQSLILAAEMLAAIKINPTTDKVKIGKDLKATGKASAAFTPDKLLADALQMDVPKEQKQVVEAMAKWVKASLAKPRDLENPIYFVDEVPAGQTAEWVRKPKAKTITCIMVKGEGAVNVEVSVFQEGQKIAWDSSPNATAFVRFHTATNQDVTIVVKNLGNQKSRFTIYTN